VHGTVTVSLSLNFIIGVAIIHLSERTKLVSGEGSCNSFIAVSRAVTVEKFNILAEKECYRQRGETSKASRILGKTRGSDN
jgi:hypothetical protein